MCAQGRDFTAVVDPFIGCGAIEGGLSGNNYPGATVPFGMVQLSPDTHPVPDWYNASGYDYNDSTIYCFSHTRLSGTGASDLIDIGVFPTVTGKTSSGFSHDAETASPGYYSVMLKDEGILAELTATTRTGIHRYTFPADTATLIFDLDHSANKGSWGRQIIQSQLRRTGPRTIEGFRVITGWAKLRKVYFVAEFSEDIAGMDIADGAGTVFRDAAVANGKALKGTLRFRLPERQLTVKVGLSGTSVDNARRNLRAEAPHFDFDRYRASAKERWNDMLGRVEVTKGDPLDVRLFYTALYHTLVQPNTFSDISGHYATPAWYVFSALGFYPVNPASGRYDIGTPLFDEVVLHLPGGKDFTITADRKTGGAHRVSRVTIDGKPVADYRLPHEAIVRGGEMRFSLK